MAATRGSRRRRMNKKWWLGGLVVVVAALVAGGWYFFLRDDAPAAVSNDQANADLDDVLGSAPASTDPTATDPDTSTGDSAPTATDPVTVDGIDGTWNVDDEIGDFDFETASGSFAGFRVAEELTAIGDTTAVGRTGSVTGTVTIADGTLTAAEITADLSAIVSDRSQREGAIRRAVNTSEFPTATFTFDGSVDVSAIEVGGPAQTFTVEGSLTVAGVTQPVTFTIDANVRDDGFGVITGSTEITWADFGVEAPSAPVVVSVADQGTVEFQLIVAR
ncbi:MAG: YceI family protein [Acidimicrobiales bacterium]